MPAESQLVNFTWRDGYDGLYGALEHQKRRNNFVNAASRITLAIMALHCSGDPLTVKSIVDYVHDELAPSSGWKQSGHSHFDRAKYEQLVWTVVATLQKKNPGQELIYVE